MQSKKAVSYDDVWLAPRKISTLKHRSEADTSIECFGIRLDIPMIASPMPDVCNGEMALKLSILGGLGIIHRFQSIEEQVEEFKLVFNNSVEHPVACAIGVTGDYKERFKILYETGCRIFCLDTANGANTQVEEAIKYIRCIHERLFIIAGNIATKEGYEYLTKLGVDAIRVGIASGAVCESKNETGVYIPTLQSIIECEKYRKNTTRHYSIYSHNMSSNIENYKKYYTKKYKSFPLIIADGGIRTPADMCKALALGADLVMCGSVFAGTAESPGNVININGELLKLYRGAASFGVQKEHKGNKPLFVEGRESLVKYKGHVENIINRFKAGLQSSMSYMNAHNFDEYKNNADFVRV